MNIIQTIAKANYAATGTQVETLAHAIALGKIGTECYLRIVVAHSQALLGTGRVGRRAKLDADAQLAVLEKVHAQLYPSVQKGIVANGLGGGEVTQAEINRRGTFARSTVSDLRGLIARGGDLRTIEVATVIRSWVRKFGKVATVPTGTRAERSFERSTEAALKAAMRIAKNNPDTARAHVEAALDRYEALLNELPGAQGAQAEDVGGTTTVVGPGFRGTRVIPPGVQPQLHRGA